MLISGLCRSCPELGSIGDQRHIASLLVLLARQGRDSRIGTSPAVRYGFLLQGQLQRQHQNGFGPRAFEGSRRRYKTAYLSAYRINDFRSG